MKNPLPMLLTAGLFLLAGQLGCSRPPEQEAPRALARLQWIMGVGSGGTIEYDEESPERPPIAVSLEGTAVLDASLRLVGKLPTLRSLNLADQASLTDVGLSHLTNLANLETLNLRGTWFTDAGLRHVGALAGLRDLDLSNNHRITDAGLKHLHGLRRLEVLTLTETAVTDAGVEELMSYLPEVQINR